MPIKVNLNFKNVIVQKMYIPMQKIHAIANDKLPPPHTNYIRNYSKNKMIINLPIYYYCIESPKNTRCNIKCIKCEVDLLHTAAAAAV